jgi:hypothetical protein
VLVRRRARLGLLHARDPQRERGVVECRQPRQQPVTLRHQGCRRGIDRAAVGRLKPAHELQQRRLPAAARTDDRDDLARRRTQGHAVQGLHGPERLPYSGDRDAA